MFGLFGWLGSKIIGSVFPKDDPVGPLPSGSIWKTISKIIDWTKETDDVSRAPAYKPEVATIDETVKFNELLTKKRDEFSSICFEFEQKINEATESIFSFFITCIEKINEQLNLTINVMYIKNEFEEYKKNLEGGISDLVNRRLALSDTECVEILGHETGDKRSAEIDRFLKKIVREGSQKYINNFDRIISQAITLVNDHIKGAYSEKMILVQRAKEELECLSQELSGL